MFVCFPIFIPLLHLGNANLALLTSAVNFELRVDLEDWEGNTAYATYKTFRIKGNRYTMELGEYRSTSTAGIK